MSWQRFETIRSRTLQRYEHFILRPDLNCTIRSYSIRWRGRLICEGGLELAIEEAQAVRMVRTQPMVRTARYSYQVLRRAHDGSAERLLRYDNVHAHPGHPDAHHVHRGERLEHMGAEHAPSLADVLAEAEHLWRLGRAES